MGQEFLSAVFIAVSPAWRTGPAGEGSEEGGSWAASPSIGLSGWDLQLCTEATRKLMKGRDGCSGEERKS